MKARLAAAGLRPSVRGGVPHDLAAQIEADQPVSARVAAARARALDRGDRQRQALRPVGAVFILIVVLATVQGHPAPGLRGAGPGVMLALAGYIAAVATAISVRWARRGLAAQAAVIGLIGGCGVALAAWQPHGAVDLAACAGVWIAAVRLPPAPAAAAAAAITASLALTVGLTEHPAVPSAVTAALVCLLMAVTGQFLRRGGTARTAPRCCWPSSRTRARPRRQRPRSPSAAGSRGTA